MSFLLVRSPDAPKMIIVFDSPMTLPPDYLNKYFRMLEVKLSVLACNIDEIGVGYDESLQEENHVR